MLLKLKPQVVHVAHLVVEHGKEAKEEVESDQVGRVEPNVPAVGEQEGEPGFQWNCCCCNFSFFPHSPLGFFQVDYAFVGDDTLTDKPDWVKGNPQRVPSNANWG